VFIRRHRNDLVRRTNAALTIEHLGLREWDELASGSMAANRPVRTGRHVRARLEGARRRLLHRTEARQGRPACSSRSTRTPAEWPTSRRGQYLFAVGEMPTSNYITGPTYLLNRGIRTTDMVNFKRVRAEAIAFTEMILRLGRTPRGKLR